MVAAAADGLDVPEEGQVNDSRVLSGEELHRLAALLALRIAAGVCDDLGIDGVVKDGADGILVEGLRGTDAGTAFGAEAHLGAIGKGEDLSVKASCDVGVGVAAGGVPLEHEADGVGFDGMEDADLPVAPVGPAIAGAVVFTVRVGAGGAVALAVSQAEGTGETTIPRRVVTLQANLLSQDGGIELGQGTQDVQDQLPPDRGEINPLAQ